VKTTNKRRRGQFYLLFKSCHLGSILVGVKLGYEEIKREAPSEGNNDILSCLKCAGNDLRGIMRNKTWGKEKTLGETRRIQKDKTGII